MQTLENLVSDFNLAANAAFQQKYKSFEPKFSNAVYSFDSGFVETVNFPFWGFIGGMQEFDGTRKHRKMPISDKYQIKNKTWDNSVDISVADLERATRAQNPLAALNIYQSSIAAMATEAREHPIQLAFDMLEAGATNVYGTAFDGENFFSTNHTYLENTTAQSNLLTGSGITAANIKSDLIEKVLTGFNSFVYIQSKSNGATSKRPFNRATGFGQNLLILAPLQLNGIFYDLQNAQIISNTTNTVVNFNYATLPFSDTNDWYAVLLDDPIQKPFINPIEKPVELDMPTATDSSIREHDVLTYGARGRHGVGYGVWWKAIKITN